MCADEIVYGNSYILKRHECCEFSLFHLYIDTWIYEGSGFAAICIKFLLFSTIPAETSMNVIYVSDLKKHLVLCWSIRVPKNCFCLEVQDVRWNNMVSFNLPYGVMQAIC